ncbi:PspC domain-containing protein [Polaribacter sp.]|uniref:PspC domain-containing protein n=1 Tax=Polaribacter sp. TaxID=1920175 RepID=UPI0040486B03
MNKTININLGGFFFHIDETAYLKLKKYLESISKSLSDDPQGKNEIIADIEARISELLSEKITDARQVVNDQDIDDIIKIMGQPEDYADGDESFKETNYSYQPNYNATKKLFRDGEDKILGGVASGMAHYLSLDTIWIRLAFILFTVFGGFGFLTYIILWVLLPEAKTTAEKLQMEGTPVNIDNIERKIREEFNNVSENLKDVANKASDKFKEGASEISEKFNSAFSGKQKKNNGFQEILDVIVSIIQTFFKVIGKIIGVFIIIIAASVIISLIIGGFSIGSLEWLNVDGNFIHYPPFFYDSVIPSWLLTTFMLFLIGIPFLLLFILGLRMLSSNIKRIGKAASLTLLGIWIVSLLGMIFAGLDFATSYAQNGEITEKNQLQITANDTLTIKLKNDENILFRHNLRRSSQKEEVFVNGKKMVYSNYVKVDVQKSTTDESYFMITKSSRGKNKMNAKSNAKEIQYHFSIENNTLILDAFYLTDFKNIWKDETIEVTIYLPEKALVYFDESAKNFLYDVKNEDDIYDTDMANHHFIMTNATLKCTDCEALLEGKNESDLNTNETSI